jgi:hypothetical protein
MNTNSTSSNQEETGIATNKEVATTVEFQASAEQNLEGETYNLKTDNLPSVMRNIVEAHDKPHRLLMLFSLFGALSSLFPTVKGEYNGERIFPNLFFYILGRAGSGKGKMNKVKQLISRLQGFVVSQNIDTINTFLEDPEEFEDLTPHPLIIPGNSTSAGMMAQLSRNQGKGLIIESEGDTLGNMFKSEHGNYSSMARQFFHHETISQYRKTDENPYVHIREPKVSMLISSTPKQIHKIIPSAENGLLSRFAFVFVDAQEEFQNVFDVNNRVINQAYKQSEIELAQTLKKIHEIGDIEVILTSEQEVKFVQFFKVCKAQIVNLINEDLDGTVNRMGIIMFRLCMILTLLDSSDNDTLAKTIVCKDEHFELTKELIEILLENADAVTKMIEGKKKEDDLTIDKREFYLALPDETFTRKEAIKISKRFDISARSVQRFLNTSVFEKPSYGNYRKVQ